MPVIESGPETQGQDHKYQGQGRNSQDQGQGQSF